VPGEGCKEALLDLLREGDDEQGVQGHHDVVMSFWLGDPVLSVWLVRVGSAAWRESLASQMVRSLIVTLFIVMICKGVALCVLSQQDGKCR
jgi:hypothetical protein